MTRWLQEWSADSSHELDGACAMPAQHTGKDITDVAADDFTCDALPTGVVCETYTSPTQPPTTTTPTPSATLGELKCSYTYRYIRRNKRSINKRF